MQSISVIIPTFNARAFIEKAVRSVFAQSLPPDEILLVDDASIDGTPQYAEALAADAPIPVRVIELPHNSGSPARPLNVGIREAVGEIIAVLDQDDTFMPDKLAKQAPLLANDQEFSFVCSGHELFGRADWSRVGERHRRRLNAWMAEFELKSDATIGEYYRGAGVVSLRHLLQNGSALGGFPAFVFRKRDWERKGGLDEQLSVSSDLDFLCWLCTQGDVAYVPSPAYRRRLHENNLSSHRVRCTIDRIMILSKYRDHVQQLGADDGIGRAIGHLLCSLSVRAAIAGYFDVSRSVFQRMRNLGKTSWTGAALASLIPLEALYRIATRRSWRMSPLEARLTLDLTENRTIWRT